MIAADMTISTAMILILNLFASVNFFIGIKKFAAVQNNCKDIVFCANYQIISQKTALMDYVVISKRCNTKQVFGYHARGWHMDCQ